MKNDNHNNEKTNTKNIHEEENCIFCKIIKKEISAEIVYEDDYTISFMDIYPNTRGHLLVIPKIHIENIYGLDHETAARLMISIQKISVATKNALDADGINILMNNEEAAGQIIWHAHIHIIPRYKDDEGYYHKKHIYHDNDEIKNIAKDIQKEI